MGKKPYRPSFISNAFDKWASLPIATITIWAKRERNNSDLLPQVRKQYFWSNSWNNFDRFLFPIVLWQKCWLRDNYYTSVRMVVIEVSFYTKKEMPQTKCFFRVWSSKSDSYTFTIYLTISSWTRISPLPIDICVSLCEPGWGTLSQVSKKIF